MVSVIRYLTDPSEGEQPEEDDDSRIPLPYAGSLQGAESETEGGDESSSDFRQIDPAMFSSSTAQTKFSLRELSGHSRALLKEFFETTDAFPLPLRNPTLAFSETKLYHLLKILINDSMSLTYTTIEKMVLDAVRGQSTTSQSRLDHFRVKTRAQTPRRGRSTLPVSNPTPMQGFLGNLF